MITLNEQIDINASFERLLEWKDNFKEEFVRWSPLHLECDYLSGSINKGDKIRFEEIVMGLDYDVTGTIIESECDDNYFKFVFESDKKTAIIIFEGSATENGCHFSHTESFGMQTPIIGPIINFLFFKILFKKKANWDLIKQDMILDNYLLKDILENHKYPNRLTMEEIKLTSPEILMKEYGYK